MGGEGGTGVPRENVESRDGQAHKYCGVGGEAERWRSRRNGFLNQRPHTSDAGTGVCRVGSRVSRRCKLSHYLRNWNSYSCNGCEQPSSRHAKKETVRLSSAFLFGLIETRSYRSLLQTIGLSDLTRSPSIALLVISYAIRGLDVTSIRRILVTLHQRESPSPKPSCRYGHQTALRCEILRVNSCMI